MQDSITASLSRFPKLQRLTLSGGVFKSFFASTMTVEWTDWTDYTELNPPVISYGEYTPKSFTEFARDLANGCRTLTVVTIGDFSGNLLIEDGLSARIVRECEGGIVKEVRRIRAWGNIIGKEEEW